MKDLRIEKLAKNLVNYSVTVNKCDSVIIESGIGAKDLVIALVREIYKKGAYPFVRLSDEQVGREVMMGMTEELSKKMCHFTLPMFEESDAYIGIGSVRNIFENSDVPSANKTIHAKYYGKPVHMDARVGKDNWVILDWPSPSLAQMAQMPMEKFEDFFFDVCTMNYAKMKEAMIPLKNLMERTDKVRIAGQDTDLSFSIKGQNAIICSGEKNIPDGEIYTSPLRTSVNGKIRFNTQTMHKGIIHNNPTFEFKDGKVISAVSDNSKELNEELDSDEGARYLGEFAFGVNPYVKKPMNETLFDEKIAGSIHFALGNSYDDAPNGNKSQIHWDIVFQGGEIYFDDVLIRKDGKFLLKELAPLNKKSF